MHYGQAYILSHPGDVNSDLDEAFAEQVNGLLGASVRNRQDLWIGVSRELLVSTL